MIVSFASEQRRIAWKVFAQDPVSVARGCLKALEDFIKCPLRGMKLRRRHVLKTKCRSELTHGKYWTVEFPLSEGWIYESCRGLPNAEGACSSCGCGELWTLKMILPHLCRVGGHDKGKAVEVGVGGTGKQFDVFISHAGIRDGDGGDKLYVARPLYRRLSDSQEEKGPRKKGLRSFLDKSSLGQGIAE